MAARFLVVSEVARQLGVPPREISDLFYQRKLDDARCPIMGGRRLIPGDYVPAIEAALRAAGRLSESAGCQALGKAGDAGCPALGVDRTQDPTDSDVIHAGRDQS
jgi:hypothetical protein